MTIIAFHTPNLNFRGSCVALRDYALHNETLLNNTSIIVTDKNQQHTSDEIAFYWFKNRFPVFMYDSLPNLEEILKRESVDILYCIKYGTNDGVYSTSVKTVVHCVFDMTQTHGDVYAGVSKSLANKFNSNLYVPHMVSIVPIDGTNLRDELCIPNNAIVFGRHGGKDTFNLQFAKTMISKIVRLYNDIFFVFMNADAWDDHPQIKILSATTDIDRKRQFLRTLDCFIVPETMGHTFNLALADACAYNIPAIIYANNVWNTAHIDIMGDVGHYFYNPDELYELITTFTLWYDSAKNYNGYRDYTPVNVMKQFARVFLD